jgi:hypothetical protein
MDESRGYAVGWFTLALLNAGLAQSKGRRGLTWGLISILLGPIATFILVAFIQPPEPTEPPPIEFVERKD